MMWKVRAANAPKFNCIHKEHSIEAKRKMQCALKTGIFSYLTNHFVLHITSQGVKSKRVCALCAMHFWGECSGTDVTIDQVRKEKKKKKKKEPSFSLFSICLAAYFNIIILVYYC